MINPNCLLHFNDPEYQDPTGEDLKAFMVMHQPLLCPWDTSHSYDERIARIMGYRDGAAVRRLKGAATVQRQAWYILITWMDSEYNCDWRQQV